MPKLNHINISERRILLRFFDLTAILLGAYFSSWSVKGVYFSINNERFDIWILTYLIYFYFFAEIFEMYKLNIANDIVKSIRSVLLAILATNILFFLTPVFTPSLPTNRLQLLYFGVAVFMPMIIFRLLYIEFIFSPEFTVNKIVIAPKDRVATLIHELELYEPEHKIVAYFSDTPNDSINHIPYKCVYNDDIKEVVMESACNEVIICPFDGGFEYKRVNEDLLDMFKRGVKVKSSVSYLEDLRKRVSRENLNDFFYEQYTFSRHYDNRMYLGFIRVLDIVMSVIILTFFVPLLPFIFLVNLFFNKGPLFYTQKRTGKKSKPFTIYKLRTMIPNAEQGVAMTSVKGDSRITRFGKFLRSSRLDEIPQMFNVLIGNMSIVGPRPERPEIVAELTKQLPFYDIRHTVKPGITGWAQVNCPYATTLEEQEEKLLYDLYYIKEKSLYLDFLIFIKTFNTVLFMKGR